ncbi:hypothetical protein B0I75DRAFT_135605 [Yarrowia lipolytica]|uniref:Uncharacterized protein n=1 Tax=Yarrowia lipolytica TaxID=4952 RepID=A0A371BX08_YARLL|nr:hypothetical protein B0I71DRAFT_137363 [Yarrowia lipolytica]RDW47753.1 hypothetical protein B0I74DRAFT_134921 [Yarrowia lipolytica]RDW53973.1 hypothetical protein B0I75DRAFT_135605 [Yarrowia lipolytica]
MISKRKLLPFIVFLVIFGTWLSLPPKKRHFVDNWRLTNYITRLGASHNLYDDTIDLGHKNGAHYFTAPRDQGPVAGHANYTEALCHVSQKVIVPDVQISASNEEGVKEAVEDYVARLPESPLTSELLSYSEGDISGHQCMATKFSQIMLVLELGYFASWGLVEESRDYENDPKEKFVMSRIQSGDLHVAEKTSVPEVIIEEDIGDDSVEEEEEEKEDDSASYDEPVERDLQVNPRAAHLSAKYPSLLRHVEFNGMDYAAFVESRDKFTSNEPFTTDHVYKNGEVEKIRHIQVPKMGPGHAAFMLRKTFNFEKIEISLSFGDGELWEDYVFEPVLRGGQRAGRVTAKYPGYVEDHKSDDSVHSFPHNDARFFGDQCAPKPDDVMLMGKVIYGADISMKQYPFDDPIWLTHQAATAWQKVKWYDLRPEFLNKGLLDSMCHFAHTNQGEAFNVEFGVGFKCSEGRHVPNLNYYFCQQLH